MNVSAFIPIDRRRALLTGRDLPDRTHGAALFVDIAGFTAMTEMLMRQFGRQEGAEAVLHYLNPINDTLIAELYRFGGSLIGFAGDSITCWLDGDDGRRAVQCGLAMQRLVQQMELPPLPQGDRLSLGIKVAIAVGPARRFVVGTEEDGFIDVLAGQTVLRMAAAEGHAKREDVVVDVENCAALLPDLTISAWRDDGRIAVVTTLHRPIRDLNAHAFRSEQWQLTPEQARPWLHDPVFERLQMGGDFLAELRPATAFFLKFEGIDFDNDDAAGQQLDQFIQWVQGWLKQLSGYLIQLTFGDKGSFLYVAFGAPRSFQNDESRAVALGVALRSASSRFPFLDTVHIGISAGRMWSGAYGSQTRMTYGVMGNETNMAARLMSKAQAGEVLISEPIYRRTNQRFEFESAGRLLPKGSKKSIGVWTVKERWNQNMLLPRFPYRLVGRLQALAQLTTFWEKTQAGQGQAVTLSGEAGVGKSHLAVAFAEKHAEMATFWGSADSYTQYTAYSAWREVFAQMLGVLGQIDEGVLRLIRPKLQQIGLADDVRLPLLGDLFGVPLAENEVTAAFEPQVRQSSLFALLVALVQRTAAREPLLIVLDNVQWLDEASRSLMDELAFATTNYPVMLLRLSRSASTNEKMTLTLSTLDREELRQLVSDRLGAPVTPLLIDILEIQTAGNPFFVEASLSTMREAGQIAAEELVWGVTDKLHGSLVRAQLVEMRAERWRLVESADLSPISVELPDTVHASILNRLDQLSEQNKLLLKVASVIGKRFDLDLLRRTHPQNPEHELMRREVAACAEEGFVQPLDSAAYSFQQNTTQEVTYSTLLFAQRRQLHAAVADALSHPDHTHLYTTEIVAAHAYEGQDWELALRTYQQLGREAKDLYANQQAIFAYQRAVASAEQGAEVDAQQLFAIHLALGTLHSRIGEYAIALQQLEIARELATTNAQLASVCEEVAATYENQGRFDKMLAEITVGLSYKEEEGWEETLELRFLAAKVYVRRGEYQYPSELAEEVLNASVKNAQFHADARLVAGYLQFLRGDFEAALSHYEQALAYYKNAHHLPRHALCVNFIGMIRSRQGRGDEAEQLYREALAIYVQMGDRGNQSGVLNNLATIVHARGEYQQALAHYDEAINTLPQIGDEAKTMFNLNRGGVLVQLDRFTEAQMAFDRAEQLVTKTNMRISLPTLHRRRAEMAFRQADFETANRQVELALAVAREVGLERDIARLTAYQQKIQSAEAKAR